MIADISQPYRSRRRSSALAVPGRLAVAVALAIVLVVYLASAVYGGISGGSADTVVIHRGDTVWSIAAAHAGGGDVRALVDQIIATNHLPAGGVLTPGQTLVVPPG